MEELRAAYRVSVIIGLSMMASLLVYAIIVGVFAKAGGPAGGPALAGDDIEIMKFSLMGISVTLFFLIRFANARILAAGEERAEGQRQAPGATPDLQRLATASVVTYALCEAPAVLGLVLFFLGGQASDFHLFLLVALFFFAVFFPLFGNGEEWYRQQQGQAARRT